MKLRLRENSIRLRLARPEVEAIGRGQAIDEAVRFPDGRALVFRLEVNDGEKQVSANLHGHALVVSVACATAARWSEGNEVGLEHVLPLQDGGHLRILIEKDFECLHPDRGETTPGAFPNPNAL